MATGSTPPVSPTSIPATTIPGVGTAEEPTEGEINIAYRTVAEEVPFPVVLTARPGSEISYVATKDGRVWELADGALREILDISDQVLDNHEQGLLGMALDPFDPELVYLHYTARQGDGDTTLSTFRFAGDGTLERGSEEVILTVDQPGAVHNGGMIQFGPHGLLYMGLGDGGGIGDPHGNGQDTGTVLGGILRIDPDGGEPYAVPSSNPFVDAPGADELWVYGLRNPWRFWIDYPTETIYIGEVGQALSEEINILGLDQGGTNLGWSIMEGLHCYGTELEPADTCDTEGLTPPVMEIEHGDQGACSITGGVVYRGEDIPALRGHYLYSDYCGGWLRSLRWENGAVVEQRDWTERVGVPGQVVSFGVDGFGEVYVLTADSILQLVPTERQ